MLAGFLAASFFFIARQIIKAGIFPQLTRQLSGDIIKIIIERLFILSLIAMILGFIGFIYEKSRSQPVVNDQSKKHYEIPVPGIIKLNLVDITAIDLLPKPEMKNVTLTFKVIPRSKDKYVPLNAKGKLVVIDSFGNQESYLFDVNIDDGGIRPQVPSNLVMDGLLSKTEYEKIISSNTYTAIGIVYYDSDLTSTNLHFESEIFPFNKTSITDQSK